MKDKDKGHPSGEDIDLNILGILSENSRENFNQILSLQVNNFFYIFL